jgi:hypothetical protein
MTGVERLALPAPAQINARIVEAPDGARHLLLTVATGNGQLSAAMTLDQAAEFVAGLTEAVSRSRHGIEVVRGAAPLSGRRV